MLQLLTLCALLLPSWAFLFGNAGCGCAPPPACAPPPPPYPQAPTGCGGGGGSYQQPSPIAQSSFSYAAPSYSQPIFPPPPPEYQPPQAPSPVPQKSQYIASQKGPFEQLPPHIYSQNPHTQQLQTGSGNPSIQETAPTVSHSSVEQQQIENKLQREAAAAGQKNEEVLEEEEGILEESAKESTDAPQDTATTELVDQLVDTANLKLTDDSLCNSEELRKLMLDNIEENLNNSKRLIQLAAEAQFGGRFDVICANGDFSYVTNTELYCQETKGAISCYTYRQL